MVTQNVARQNVSNACFIEYGSMQCNVVVLNNDGRVTTLPLGYSIGMYLQVDCAKILELMY